MSSPLCVIIVVVLVVGLSGLGLLGRPLDCMQDGSVAVEEDDGRLALDDVLEALVGLLGVREAHREALTEVAPKDRVQILLQLSVAELNSSSSSHEFGYGIFKLCNHFELGP